MRTSASLLGLTLLCACSVHVATPPPDRPRPSSAPEPDPAAEQRRAFAEEQERSRREDAEREAEVARRREEAVNGEDMVLKRRAEESTRLFGEGCRADREQRAAERQRLLALANARRDYEIAHCKASFLTRTIPNDEVRADQAGHLVRGTDTVSQRVVACDDPPDIAAAEAQRKADQSRLEHRDMGCYFFDHH